MTATERSYDWVFIAWPESLPDDWMEVLGELPCAISPLHDKDTWTITDEKKNPDHAAGTLKKPHYHVMIHFDTQKSYRQVKKLTDRLGQSRPEPVMSPYAKYRYLSHKDNPDKAQYDEKDILLLGGFVPPKTMSRTITKEQQRIYTMRLFDYCYHNIITRFNEILLFLEDLMDTDKDKKEEYLDMLYLATRNTPCYGKVTHEIREEVMYRPEVTGIRYANTLYNRLKDSPDRELKGYQMIADKANNLYIADSDKVNAFSNSATKQYQELLGKRNLNDE